MQRLQEQFRKDFAPKLREEFGFANPLQVPQIQKIVVNVGIGKIKKDTKFVDAIVEDLKSITGQAPVRTKARKSIAGFKVRENEEVGIMLTLRGLRMWSFLDKLINVALPRVRDFRGIPDAGFDGQGNFHLGLKEQLVFPEISADALEHTFGMQISIVTNSKNDAVTRKLLTLMRFPFRSGE
jgi:large subunit ribosomal protein L5